MIMAVWSGIGLALAETTGQLTHLFNILDVNTPKNARSSRKVEENKVTLCGVPSSWNVQK